MLSGKSMPLGLTLLAVMIMTPSGAGVEGNLEDDGLKEAYISYLNNYDPPSSDLENCDETIDGIESELVAEGAWLATKVSELDDEEPFKRADLGGTSDDNADASDFAVFCGHGDSEPVSTPCAGGAEVDGTVSFQGYGSSDVLINDEAGYYGEYDGEFVFFDTSKSLRVGAQNPCDNLYQWHSGMASVHMIIGWHDSPYDRDSGFQFFDEMLDTSFFTDGGGHKVMDAYFDSFGGCNNQYSGATQNIIFEHVDHRDSYIHGESSGPGTSHDADGLWYYDTHNC